MTRPQLASLLRTSTGRIARLEVDLMERGWLRPVTSNDVSPGTDAPAHDQVSRLDWSSSPRAVDRKRAVGCWCQLGSLGDDTVSR